jgi:hypothetical protein
LVSAEKAAPKRFNPAGKFWTTINFSCGLSHIWPGFLLDNQFSFSAFHPPPKYVIATACSVNVTGFCPY